MIIHLRPAAASNHSGPLYLLQFFRFEDALQRTPGEPGAEFEGG